MHRVSIVSPNLDTEIKQKLTRSVFGTWIAFQWDMRLKDSIYLSIPLAMQEPLLIICQNPISKGWFDGEAICWGQSLRVQQASHSD